MTIIDINSISGGTQPYLNIPIRVLYPNRLPTSRYQNYLNPSIKDYDKSFLFDILKNFTRIFGWKKNLEDIELLGLIKYRGKLSFRFAQKYGGLFVGNSDIIMNFDCHGTLNSIYNDYHYDIPSSTNVSKVKITKNQALKIVKKLSNDYPKDNRYDYTAELILYEHGLIKNKPVHGYLDTATIRFLEKIEKNSINIEKGEHLVVWKVKFHVEKPSCYWCVMICADSGKIVNIIDLLKYITGKGNVFDPNPTLKTGDLKISNLTDSNIVNGYLKKVNLENLDDLIGGQFRLNGSYVRIKDYESPHGLPPLVENGEFFFKYKEIPFLCVNAYYHIDRFIHYLIHDLQITEFKHFKIDVDVDGVEGQDNSHYKSDTRTTGRYIAFGSRGNADASDEQVIIHELSHALFDVLYPGFNDTDGINEGSSDAVSMIFFDDKNIFPEKTRYIVMPWDASPIEGRNIQYRRCDLDWKFDDLQFVNESDVHTKGQLICSVLFELYRKIGGDSNNVDTKHYARDMVLKLIFLAVTSLRRSNSSAINFFNEMKINDVAANGSPLLTNLFQDVFSNRHLPTFSKKDVDIYVGNIRHGGYGSISGNDLPSEKLWMDQYWKDYDIWFKKTPYQDDNITQQANKLDHEMPTIGESSHIYIKLKNKGKKNSSLTEKITVQIFRSTKGLKSLFPTDWQGLDIKTVYNIKPGDDNGLVVGPFNYIQEKENECIIAVVNSVEDESLVKSITNPIECFKIFPLDNNVGIIVL